MYDVALYFVLFLWVNFLFVTDGGYRNVSFWMFVVLAFAAWMTRKRWMVRMKARYSQLGITMPEKTYSALAGQIVWIGLELYCLIVLFLIPGALSISPLPDIGGIFFVMTAIVLIVVTLCDSQFDVILTGERELPRLLVRIMPVSLLAAICTAFLWLTHRIAAGERTLALCLLVLFLAELAINLGIRRVLQKKREKSSTGAKTAAGRELRLVSELLIWGFITAVCPLLPLLQQKEEIGLWGIAVPLLLFAVQALCLLLFYRKRAVWTAYIQSYVKSADSSVLGENPDVQMIADCLISTVLVACLIIFGTILPALLLPGTFSFDLFILFLVIFLLTDCLSAPLYGLLTGIFDGDKLPGVGRRVPYVTLAACVYAVVTVPMPWTDSLAPELLAALALIELAFMLGLRRMTSKRGQRIFL